MAFGISGEPECLLFFASSRIFGRWSGSDSGSLNASSRSAHIDLQAKISALMTWDAIHSQSLCRVWGRNNNLLTIPVSLDSHHRALWPHEGDFIVGPLSDGGSSVLQGLGSRKYRAATLRMRADAQLMRFINLFFSELWVCQPGWRNIRTHSLKG